MLWNLHLCVEILNYLTLVVTTLRKFRKLGVPGRFRDWIKSYLTYRSFYVKTEDSFSWEKAFWACSMDFPVGAHYKFYVDDLKLYGPFSDDAGRSLFGQVVDVVSM